MRKRQNGVEKYFPPAERVYADYLHANPRSMLGVAPRSATPARAAPQSQGTMSAAVPRPKPGQRTFEMPDARDLDHLVVNPHLRNEFEYVFGPAEQYLTQSQLEGLPNRDWDPWTMPHPTRGYVEHPPRGGAQIDEDGNRLPRDRLPAGAYKLASAAEDKALPIEGGVLPTKGPPRTPAQLTPRSTGEYFAGVYDPFGLYRQDGGRRPHYGPDVPALTGAAVRAAASGRAIVFQSSTLGNGIAVQHADGTTSLYAHLSKVGVKTGDVIMAGDTIGAVGLTGNASKYPNNPHLHFEVLPADPARSGPDLSIARRTIDPVEWLKQPMWYRGRILPSE